MFNSSKDVINSSISTLISLTFLLSWNTKRDTRSPNAHSLIHYKWIGTILLDSSLWNDVKMNKG